MQIDSSGRDPVPSAGREDGGENEHQTSRANHADILDLAGARGARVRQRDGNLGADCTVQALDQAGAHSDVIVGQLLRLCRGDKDRAHRTASDLGQGGESAHLSAPGAWGQPRFRAVVPEPRDP